MINWQIIMIDLKRNYKSLEAIANELDISPKTLQKIARNGCKDMLYGNGTKVMQLHQQVMGKL